MIPKKSIQPMELVISAIHCLKERKGSSPKEILKYLEEKYDISGDAFRADVESGLKRGVSFGLINQNGRFYRLNKVLRSPLRKCELKTPRLHKLKIRRANIGLKRLKFGKSAKKVGKMSHKKKSRSAKRRKTKSNKAIKGRNFRRQIDARRRKFKRQKAKVSKASKPEKAGKLQNENGTEFNTLKTEDNCKI